MEYNCQYDIIISYINRPNKYIAEILRNLLENYGITVYLIESNDSLENEYQQKSLENLLQDKCNWLLAIVSDTYLLHKNAKNFLNIAEKKNVREKRTCLIILDMKKEKSVVTPNAWYISGQEYRSETIAEFIKNTIAGCKEKIINSRGNTNIVKTKKITGGEFFNFTK